MIVREQDGVKVVLVDRLPPEVLAKVQALYARKNVSMEEHLKGIYAEQHRAIREVIEELGGGLDCDLVDNLADAILELMDAPGSSAAKFMDTWVVKYNHKSIHDCATGAVLGIEGLSELAAKVFQHHPLFSGTATSTRAIDMGSARLVDPIGTAASRAVHGAFMDFYRRNFAKVAEEVRRRYPRKEGESEKDYEGAVSYRVQDVLGAFLPAGLCAQTSVAMNLRQWSDHLSWLLVHPLEEVRRVARLVQEILRERYPASGDFGGDVAAVSGVVETDVDARATWRKKVSEKWAYQPSLAEAHACLFSTVDARCLDPYADIFADRPRGEVLPRFLDDLGQCTANFLMSHRSWRDIERQRAGTCRVPVLTMKYGFARWYLDQLPGVEEGLTHFRDGKITHTLPNSYSGLALEAVMLLDATRADIEALTDDPLVRMYFTPMGYQVPTTLTYTLPVWVYVLELRTASTVHPEVRGHMLDIVKSFREVFGDRVPLHVDESPDPWNLRRGMQTIEKR